MDQGTIRLVLLLLAFFFGGALYSFLLSRITRNGIVLYLPTILGGLASGYFLYLIYFTELEGFLDIAYFLSVLMFVAILLGNVLANVIIGARRRRSRR